MSSALTIDRSSYVDPNGFVFHENGRILRAVYTPVADFYRELLTNGTLDRLQSEHGLVATRASDRNAPSPDVGLVLEHERVEPLSYCVEWPPSMLREAALCTLRLCRALLEFGATLQDGYPWNVLFRGTEPVFVDLTSIVPADSHLPWPAYAQFQSFFLRPLTLARYGRGHIARALLTDPIGGIGLEDYDRALPLRFKCTHPSHCIAVSLDRRIQRSERLKRSLKQLGRAQEQRMVPNATRMRFLDRLERRVASLRFRDPGDPWKDYYAGIAEGVDQKQKLSRVGEILGRLAPATVVDLGCNTGVFSLLAAEQGARVVSLDSSEACIEQLYTAAQAQGHRITPLVAELLSPTPTFGLFGEQFPPLLDRVRSDVALCLGLMHHLHVAGRQPFRNIAELLSRVAEHYVVFEYVDVTDDNIDLIDAPREIAYDLESVRAALAVHFPHIEVHDSDRPSRRLLVCSR